MYAMLLLISPLVAAALSFVLRGDAVLSALFGFAALGVVSFAGFVYEFADLAMEHRYAKNPREADGEVVAFGLVCAVSGIAGAAISWLLGAGDAMSLLLGVASVGAAWLAIFAVVVADEKMRRRYGKR